LLVGGVAVAAPPATTAERVAVAVFTVSGQPLGDEAQQKLKASLRGGLGAAGFEVVPEAEVEKAVAAGGLAGCDTLSCMRRIGELVLARRVLKASVEVLGTTHVVSELSLIDLSDGKVAASAKDNCDVCTMKEVNDGLSNAAAALRMQLEPPAAATPPPVAPAPAPVAPVVTEAPRNRALWLGLTGASAGLAVGSAIALGVSAGFDGKTDCSGLPLGDACNKKISGTTGIIIGAIGLPVFAVATGIFAWKAARAGRQQHVSLAPATPATSASAFSGAW
ncbi:MAG TPA: hypothetical protein VIA18_10275, partial [Polyangia bacterium]|nr:hypothetical protein [Polyangia bacterium]